MTMEQRKTGVQTLPTADQLAQKEDGVLNPKRIEVPAPPKDLLNTQASLAEKGITIFEAHYLPTLTLE